MKLKEILAGLDILSATADLEMEIPGVSYDSRKTQAGDLFVAVTGYAVDGHHFIGKAREQGAAAVLCERIPEEEIPYVQVADSRRGLAVVGGNFFGHPANDMVMTAVTGTCGKTTTTYLLKFILEKALGAKVGLIGTNQNMIGEKILPTDRTTPESFEVQRLFSEMKKAGCTHVVMETSSHALYEDRVYGVPFQVGVFTNLSQDHLDFHKTMENYCDAKAILFRNCKNGVVNGDDPWTKRLLKDATCVPFTYGCGAQVDLRAEDIQLSADAVDFDAVCREEKVPVHVGIPGEFMVYNTLDAIGAALQLGVSLKDCAAALREAPRVQGRVEVVPTPGKDYTILIDYAHTPDSMVNVLQTVQGFAKARTIALFGCGGDRDRTKRPKMGKAAADYSDFAVVTTDNPRTEDPAAIIQDILPGFDGSKTPYEVVVDRVEAIHWAMDHAQKDDIIVLLGKGHETYQEINHVKHHMDEREIVADYLSQNH